MPAISTGIGLALAAGIGGATSIASGAMGANAAGNAADAQSQAAIQAAQIQANEADKGLQFQENQYKTGQNELAPWLRSGTSALAQLDYGLGLPVSGNATIPGAGNPVQARGNAANPGATRQLPGQPLPGIHGPINLAGNPGNPNFRAPMMGGRFDASERGFEGARGGGAAPVPTNTSQIPTHQVSMASMVNPALGKAGYLNFTPPTALTEQNDPGYQARMNLGTDAIQRSAAAQGGVLSGGTARALDTYAQDYASNEYQNVYNRALTNNTTAYSRLASLAGLGQQTAGTAVGAGNNSANSIANTLMTLGELQGNAYQNAGAARASGYVGGANAWGGAINNLGSYASLLPMLQMMQNGNNGVPTAEQFGMGA